MHSNKARTNPFLLLWYSHHRAAVGLVLLALNLAIILLFTVILSLLTGNGFFDELSYLFTFTMSSDGIYDFVNNQDDLACFLVKIVLAILQMVIFSGALIGFTTEIIQSHFDNHLENKGKMRLKNHFVFLNWSTIGQDIIHDLSFLDGKKTVIILTNDDRETVTTSIDNIFTATGRKRKRLRVFVKKGDPLSAKHLADISISEAKHIGILLPHGESVSTKGISPREMTVFKQMLCILSEAPQANFVVETESETTKKKIDRLIAVAYPDARQRVSIFSHNAIMGHLLGRIAVDPAYAPLFHQILSFDGVELYGIPPMDLEEALYTYSD